MEKERPLDAVTNNCDRLKPHIYEQMTSTLERATSAIDRLAEREPNSNYTGSRRRVCVRAPYATSSRAGLMTTVLFACVHNAGRSQIAAAFFNQLADPRKARAVSAGTNPGAAVHSEVVEAMREVGIDLSRASTTKLTPDLAQQARVLVTMGCGDECPYVPGVTRDDWPLEDPKGKPLPRVRAIRDDIRERVQTLISREGWGRE